MFYKNENQSFKESYIESLQVVGSLSNLFSDSEVPYLYYRIAEKLFCNSFQANDLSRGDIALDASKGNIGIGLKTFLQNNNRTLQKVAEFNKDNIVYTHQDSKEIIKTVASLRNQRIEFAEKLSGVEKSYYHCIVRAQKQFSIFEEEMDYITLDNINDIKKKKNVLWFHDGLHEYNFNVSKSTLFKRFNTSNSLQKFDVNILENPLEEINKCINKNDLLFQNRYIHYETVYLPLYGKDKKVPAKSGLNQWNASGRDRHPNEIYIPIPAKVHQYSEGFFPERDEPFKLHLPSGEILNVKVCQDNDKALMSNPNKALGQWLLRDILDLEEGELLTYTKLETIGIDSVRLDKIDNENFKINFVSLGSFEDYLEEYES